MFEPNNPFPIENAEEFLCRVMYCNINQEREELMIHAQSRNGDKFRLYCIELRYFSGPMQWSGIDFEVKSQEECKNLLVQNGYSKELADFLLQRGISLFEKKIKQGGKIQIIARYIEKINHNP